MNKLKELWSYAVFRWICMLPLIVFLIFLVVGCAVFAGIIDPFDRGNELVVFAICITTLRVWWRPIWKLLKQAIGFLNKKAD